MAIFTKFNQQADLPTNFTNISKSTRINGTIRSQCPIQIDGHHEGIINARKTVSIGRQGDVKGDITATKLIVSGAFKGVADCVNVQICNGGNVRGKIISNHLTIDHDSRFEGESIKKENATKADEVKIA